MFENITPEDFFRETSAVRTTRVPDRVRSLGLDRSDLGFEKFIQDQLTQCRTDTFQDDDFIPRAVLANSDEWRIFHGEDDEIPAHFAGRLNREATQMKAHWMFMALVAPARAVVPGQPDPDPVDPDDLNAIAAAMEAGELHLGVCWTAGSITSGQLEYRGGIIYLDVDGKAGGEVQGVMDPTIEDPFTRVLVPGS